MNGNIDGSKSTEDGEMQNNSTNYCRNFVRGNCTRENCKFVHELPPKSCLKEIVRFCHDFQNKGCFRANCKFIHSTIEDEERFYTIGCLPRDPRSTPVCLAYLRGECSNEECQYIHPPDVIGNELPPIQSLPPPNISRARLTIRDDDNPPEAKFRRLTYDEIEKHCMPSNTCTNCESLDHKIKLLHDNISVLLKKVGDLAEKNTQLTSMNEFLLEQTTAMRNEHPCVITSRHGTSAQVSLATVSMTPVVSLAGSLPTLVPAAATTNLTLAPAASRAQLLAPAPQILTVSTTQQLVGNSGTLIVTSAGAQQLMQVSDSGTLMGGGQTVVAVTPAQLTLAPAATQLMSGAPQNAVQHQFAAAQQQHLAAQQNVQHLTAHQSALVAQQSAQQQLAAQQSAQHLAQQTAQLAAQQSAQQQFAAQQSAQHLAQQNAQQMAAQSAQQLMHDTTQQITISSSNQAMALPNSQAQSITFPILITAEHDAALDLSC